MYLHIASIRITAAGFPLQISLPGISYRISVQAGNWVLCDPRTVGLYFVGPEISVTFGKENQPLWF